MNLDQFFHSGRIYAIELMWDARSPQYVTNEYLELNSSEQQTYWKIWWRAKQHIVKGHFPVKCDYCDADYLFNCNGMHLCAVCAEEIC